MARASVAVATAVRNVRRSIGVPHSSRRGARTKAMSGSGLGLSLGDIVLVAGSLSLGLAQTCCARRRSADVDAVGQGDPAVRVAGLGGRVGATHPGKARVSFGPDLHASD